MNKKTKSVLAIIVALILIFAAGSAVVFAVNAFKTTTAKPGPSLDISKTFTSIGRTKDGRATDGNLPIKLTNAQIATSVLVNGETATARNGKMLLVVYMEIENKYQVTLYSKPYNLLRLVRSDGKRIAPSVYQGDVEVLPISLKKTNVAFVIDPSEKHFTIETGEVNGKKEAIVVNFK